MRHTSPETTVMRSRNRHYDSVERKGIGGERCVSEEEYRQSYI